MYWKKSVSLHRRRPDSNRDMTDLQSVALAIWRRRPQLREAQYRQIRPESTTLRRNEPKTFPTFYRKFWFRQDATEKFLRFCRYTGCVPLPLENYDLTPTVLCCTDAQRCHSRLRPGEYFRYRRTIYRRRAQNNAVCQNRRRKTLLRLCYSKTGRRYDPGTTLLRSLSKSHHQGTKSAFSLFQNHPRTPLQTRRHCIESNASSNVCVCHIAQDAVLSQRVVSTKLIYPVDQQSTPLPVRRFFVQVDCTFHDRVATDRRNFAPLTNSSP